MKEEINKIEFDVYYLTGKLTILSKEYAMTADKEGFYINGLDFAKFVGTLPSQKHKEIALQAWDGLMKDIYGITPPHVN